MENDGVLCRRAVRTRAGGSRGNADPVETIRISNLVKKYGNVVAVDNLSLVVPEGTIFGFLAPTASRLMPRGTVYKVSLTGATTSRDLRGAAPPVD